MNYIGVIPGAGDIADATLNYVLVLRKARQAEIPDWLVRRMLLNNLLSALVGFVPIVGDIVLAAFKANSRNAALLEEFLRIRGEEFLKAQSERVQDANVVLPGAGREVGEHVPGKADGNGSGNGNGNWWGIGKKKSKGKEAARAEANANRGRFVEDVPLVGEDRQKT